MLVLIVHIGSDRYALEAGRVAEVVPLISVTSLPRAADCVMGLCNFRGRSVPIIDLCQLFANRPCRALLSTRTVMVNCAPGKLLGLLAERVTQTIKRDPEEFQTTSVADQRSHCLRGVATDGDGMLHLIDVDAMLSNELRSVLFHDKREASAGVGR